MWMYILCMCVDPVETRREKKSKKLLWKTIDYRLKAFFIAMAIAFITVMKRNCTAHVPIQKKMYVSCVCVCCVCVCGGYDQLLNTDYRRKLKWTVFNQLLKFNYIPNGTYSYVDANESKKKRINSNIIIVWLVSDFAFALISALLWMFYFAVAVFADILCCCSRFDWQSYICQAQFCQYNMRKLRCCTPQATSESVVTLSQARDLRFTFLEFPKRISDDYRYKCMHTHRIVH